MIGKNGNNHKNIYAGVVGFGAYEVIAGDDCPDFVIPMSRVAASSEVTRGLVICGSGVKACVAANRL